MTISPAVAGFIKGLVIAALLGAVIFLEKTANLNGVVTPVIAALIAGAASSVESYLKAQSGNTTALFGAVALAAPLQQ